MAIDNKVLNIREVLQEKIASEYARVYQTKMEKGIPSIDWRNDKINVVSLFSGCGGFDLGFELAGLVATIGEEQAMTAFRSQEDFNAIRHQSIFHTIYTVDCFKEANQSYSFNFPANAQQTIDIRKVHHFPKADLVIGGFPCTGYSEGGLRLIDDERNFLYIHFIRCITQAKPDVFVAENVKGLMTIGKGEVIKQITEDFAACGYDVQYQLLSSEQYGVPQLRERVFIVGVKKGLGFKYNYPQPTHGEGLLPFVTLREAIGDLEANPGPYFTGSYSSIYMSRNRKKRWDEQSFTIQASGRQAPLHPSGLPMEKVGKDEWSFPDGEEAHRRLSVREIARIQTFPDWFTFSDGGNQNVTENNRLDKQYKQIGNAVPVLLAKAVADPIAKWAVERVKSRVIYETQQLQLF
ncbi:DNA cytosine methyltransferase [Lysinibacillus sp. KU-BSD001]|uniref:DNA cytosine methyltransferase n=1 Tax=Lysinibacillus sp. KU-BSD001 TaxID=3141328 RepID=UPI0036EB2A0A